jgi:ankyrin repeat protein
MTSPNSHLLWIFGKAGSGKSTLLMTILKNLSDRYSSPFLSAMLDKRQRDPFPSMTEPTPIINTSNGQMLARKSPKPIIASFFYSRTRDFEKQHGRMLQSVLFQILNQDRGLFRLFSDALSQVPGEEFQWPVHFLWNIFKSLVELQSPSRVIFLLLDAFDESDRIQRNQILGLLTQLSLPKESDRIQRDQILGLLPQLSRPEKSGGLVFKIVLTMRERPNFLQKTIDSESIVLENYNDTDINYIVKLRMESFESAIMKEIDERQRKLYDLQKFKTELTNRADGVILWVSLILSLVERLHLTGDIPPAELMGTLDKLPHGLEELYVDIVERLKNELQDDVEKSKKWLKCGSFAERPLTAKEFGEAITILKFDQLADISSESFQQHHFPITQDLSLLRRALSYTCGGFLVIGTRHGTSSRGFPAKLVAPRTGNQVMNSDIQVLHETVKDFLRKETASPFNATEEQGNQLMSQICIRYLKLSLSEVSFSTSKGLSKKVSFWGEQDYKQFVELLEKLPLLEYVFRFLPKHLQRLREGVSEYYLILSAALEEIRKVSNEPGLLVSSSWVYRVCGQHISLPEADNGSPSYLSQFWASEAEKHRNLMSGQLRQVSSGFLASSIVAAAGMGYLGAVRALLAAGAQSGVTDSITFLTAEEAAEKFGHLEVLETLNSNEVNPQPVSLGSNESVHESTWKDSIIPSSAVTDSQESPKTNSKSPGQAHFRPNHTLLHTAAQRGDMEVVKLLLNNGEGADVRDKSGRSPIHYAAANGHDRILRTLLNSGANINSKDEKYQTPLMMAAANGHEMVVKILLQNGADINTQDVRAGTALSLADSANNETVVQLLLAAGAHDRRIAKEDRRIFMVPYPRYRGFVGRMNIFNELERTLLGNTSHTACLWGLGGIGLVHKSMSKIV